LTDEYQMIHRGGANATKPMGRFSTYWAGDPNHDNLHSMQNNKRELPILIERKV